MHGREAWRTHYQTIAGAKSTLDFREIRLEEIPSKVQGLTIRPQLQELVGGNTSVSQMGSGLHGGSTEPVFLRAQAAIQTAVVQGSSAAVLFVDLQAAFSSVVHALVVDDGTQINEAKEKS